MSEQDIVLMSDIAKVWRCDTRTVESGLRRQGIPIIVLSPHKRAVLQSHYALLLANRTNEIGAAA